jgi:hypothetical protein
LDSIAACAQVVLVDGSPGDVFDVHAARCDPSIAHLRVDLDLAHFANGKVAGVLTGLRRAAFEHVVIADDDVRYDESGLQAVVHELDMVDVVRPQNYFSPAPWHSSIDTARTLINRMTGGDWPATLGVRRSALRRAHGYDGDVLFENLELVRTVVAAGGRASTPLGLYVRREPPTCRHFWSQRVRQAHDEFARPARLLFWLSVGPAMLALLANRAWWWCLAAVMAAMLTAEAGRWRANGRRVFPPAATFAAPIWVTERAICAWMAVGAYAIWRGVPYRGRVLRRAATSVRELQERQRERASVPARW